MAIERHSVEQTLRDRISFLEEENRQLLELLRGTEATVFQYECAFAMTDKEAEIFSMLMGRTFVPKRTFDVLWSDRQEPPDEKLIDVFIHKVRRRLEPYCITIETHHGRGYLHHACHEGPRGAYSPSLEGQGLARAPHPHADGGAGR